MLLDAENLLSHFRDLVSLLRVATPQTTINPQGRPIMSMPECLELEHGHRKKYLQNG